MAASSAQLIARSYAFEIAQHQVWVGAVAQKYGITADHDDALKGVLEHEGGNDDDPRDPGGRTSRGILQTEWDTWRKTHPGLPSDVWKAPQVQVVAIYDARYWNALRCNDLPAGVDYAVFDYGVNSGVSRAAKVLQRLLGFTGVDVDGEIGPATVSGAAKKDPVKLVNAICDERIAFLRGLSTWSTFGKGWSRRVADVRTTALAMARAAAPTQPASPSAPAPQRGMLGRAWDWFAGRTPSPSVAPPAEPPAAPAAGVPPWLATMRSITGTLEAPQSADNPDILAWRDEIARRYPEMAKYCAGYVHDEIPWCGLTVAYCMAHNGVRPVFGTKDTDRFLWADAWSRWGTRIAAPKLGCVMVFTRAGGGHVALYEAEDETRYFVRGGNQHDSVSTGYFPKSQFTAAIWPTST